MTTTNTATVQLPATGTAASDYLLDLSCEIITTAAQANRRDRNSAAAHAAGCEACEICGRALKTRVAVLDAAGVQVAVIGPECGRKIAKLLAA